jgi:hypothetical protein
MTRTPASVSNQRTWTWSGWVKRGVLGTQQKIFFAGASGTNFASFEFISGNNFQFFAFNGSTNAHLITTQVFRDPSSWYHIVFVADTTNATASNRLRLFVNGTQVTSFSTATYPSQNFEFPFNNTVPHNIGRDNPNASDYFDGYLADVNFVDGQSLTPDYFGATNPNTGVWQPSQYRGTYGTNGFYLPMNIEVLQKSFTRSLRFSSSSSDYLNRTPASASNQKTWTFSAWVKRGQLGSSQIIAQAGTGGTNFTYIAFFNSSDQLVILDSTVSGVSSARTSSAVFRDPSAWYHIVVNLDANNSVARGYVNGVEQTFTGTQPSNQNWAVNSAIEHRIGRAWGVNTSYLDGYITEVNFVDGLALTPGYFGQTDTTSGAWQPVAYTGQYGTNGFFLPFTNISSVSALGFDASGRNNNWTTNNFSLTAGSTYDSMTDVPTLTSATEANFCSWNPLNMTTVSTTTTEANLRFFNLLAGAWRAVSGTIAPTSGKFYWECFASSTTNGYMIVGVLNPNNIFLTTTASATFWEFSTGYGYYGNSGNKINNGLGEAYGSTFTNADIIGVALDLDNGKIFFSKNGTWQASGDPAAGTNPAYSGIVGPLVPAVALVEGGASATANFGQRPFTYTPPTGFVAINAFNL